MSCVDGSLFPDHMSFENFNESTKLEASVNAFQTRCAKLLEHIAIDKIYGTRENRKLLEEKSIRASVKPLGRPKNDTASDVEARWRKR